MAGLGQQPKLSDSQYFLEVYPSLDVPAFSAAWPWNHCHCITKWLRHCRSHIALKVLRIETHAGGCWLSRTSTFTIPQWQHTGSCQVVLCSSQNPIQKVELFILLAFICLTKSQYIPPKEDLAYSQNNYYKVSQVLFPYLPVWSW